MSETVSEPIRAANCTPVTINTLLWRFGRIWLLGLCLLLLTAGSSTASPDSELGMSVAAFTAQLDTTMPQLLQQFGVPGASMALIHQGDVVWVGAYGYADLAKKQPMTTDATCRTESISKSVTTWGVMKLVADGRINLDTPVQQYLPDFDLPLPEAARSQITVRRLLSNSAGLSLGTIGPPAEYAPQTPMPALETIMQQEIELAQSPGDGFLYSNVGFNLLEMVVEHVTGRTFADYMAAEVFAPLGMDQASFVWQPTHQIPTGYEPDGTPVAPYVYPVHAAGGLLANVEDVAQFVSAGTTSAAAGNSVLPPDSVSQIYAPAVAIPGLFGMVAEDYGFGHFLETLPDGRQAVWHGGQGHGWMTHFHLVPETGDGIIILTNSQSSWPLIARVLQDWARWSGQGTVKFGRIITATAVLQLIVVLIGLATLWLALRLGRDVYQGRRRLVLFAPHEWHRRLLQTGTGAAILAALVWRMAQPYRIETAVFPTTSVWLEATVAALALFLILSALVVGERRNNL